ncbi:MAG: SNF2-related protein, partial [Anaerolineales bacterium]
GATYGLKRAVWPLPYGTYALRARVHPFDFLLRHVPALAQAGFEIYGEEALKIGKINRSTPTLRVSLTSGIDWFDLKAMVEFGDQQISLHEVRKALQRGQRFIKLADGSAGQIPEEFLEKYRHLWKLATETEDGFRVSNAHLPLMDTLLADDPGIKVPPDLLERRNRLRSFEQISPQPLPQNFVGELRAYQKHGVDWLHFLREFRFGGILADDMGLGKTVQVLAFLQALKERSRRSARGAALLVVPKSLLANWQREAARFTPELRFLPYYGAIRSKDTALFKGQDVVLTTYGIMLRDIDSLRHYPFEYVILDESQAIKNPLAKAAKAARLLKAEHRLVMTGTPVENNTLDLWSQFAFLNPGLLGNLDFFRHEFATPIESRGDEAAADTLRRLAYPFILRRTKAQVAPELPARTERIIYADMDKAQKKLYAQTRDRYRAELLGLIESQGLNDARFKILEGLLRLRQIALHPALVDGTYRGEAPKIEILLETLETLQAENHKALIFSQFVGMLKLVKRELDERGLRYVYLDGKTTDRQARVDLFQNDPAYPFFLISLKAGGVGLNLTAAEYVIHLDPWWNPAVEMQASDRAHRIGQAKPVFIYKLIARDTVEEKILQLQEKKRTLVKSLVT